jgi:arylsulfatase
LFVADGIGYSDLGCYGGEAQTPYLDYLASNGARCSQAYSTGNGPATRSALLSGYYPQHIDAGMLNPGRMLPACLKTAGYRCYQAGPWDFALDPRNAGFDHSYARMLQQQHGGTEMFWTRDGQKVPPKAKDAEAFDDSSMGLLDFLREHSAQNNTQPFFVYAAIDAPDCALVLTKEENEAYADKFGEGTESLRQGRLERLWERGLAVHAELSSPAKPAIEWSALNVDERRRFQQAMALRAAAIGRMDRRIGRVLEQVKAMGAWNQTVVLFTSSSGAAINLEAPSNAGGAGESPTDARGIQLAAVANTPFRFGGGTVFEGGIAGPLIAHWPAGVKSKDGLREQVIHSIDFAATILKLTGAQWPKKVEGREEPAADGLDVGPALLENKAISSRVLWWQTGGGRAFRLGDWKWLESNDKTQELYYLRADRSESRDLAPANHERCKEMELQWGKMLARFKKDTPEPSANQEKAGSQ